MVIFIIWIVFIRLEQKPNLNHITSIWKYFCGFGMSSEKKMVLNFDQYLKLTKVSSTIYADFESLVKKEDECKNNPKTTSSAKLAEHIPSSYSLSTILPFEAYIISIICTEVKIVWKNFKNT